MQKNIAVFNGLFSNYVMKVARVLPNINIGSAKSAEIYIKQRNEIERVSSKLIVTV